MAVYRTKNFRLLVPVLFLACGAVPAAQAVKPGADAAFQQGAGPAAAPGAGLSVKDLGPLLSPAVSSFPVVGQGGNYSLALEDGRTLWFLNNIWTGELRKKGEVSLWGIVDGGVAVLEATAPYSAGGKFGYVADENRWPLPVLSADMAEYASVRKFWPRAGVRACGGYYLYYSLMNNFGTQVYDHFRVGQGLASAAEPLGPYTMLKVGDRRAFWNDIEPAFGSAVWPDRDGWLYVYGRVMTEPGKYSAALAKVQPDSIADRDRYLYYSLEASSGLWTPDVGEATPVLDGMPDEFSVSYNEYLKKYLALYSGADGGALMRTGDYPWGPWSAPQSVLSCKKEEYCFGAKEQAAFSAEGGRKAFFTVEKKNMPRLYELEFK